MKSDYNKKSLEIEILDKIVKTTEMNISTLYESFPDLEKEVLMTLGQLQEHGQVEMQNNVVRILKGGDDFKVKDFESYFK